MNFAVATAISWFSIILTYAIIARILLSWFPIGRQGFIAALLAAFTEPFIGPVRKLINRSPLGQGMMIDFSPMLTLIAVRLISNVLIGLVLSA